MGVATPGGVSLWLGTVGGPEQFVPGHVACVAHSGSIGEAFLASGPRVGYRTVISAGSEVSRDIADFVGYLAEDEGTRAIGLFVETIRRPDAFAAALARAADAGKPVVCLKVGRSQAAARAALAHSGAIVGSARAFSALLRHHGALEVSDFHELLETLEVLGRRRWPRGLRIAAVSESGGECGLLADHGEEAAIPFAPFDSALQARLVEAFPNFTQPENPLDCWAIDAYEHVFPGTLQILRETGSYDVLLAQLDLSRHRGAHEEGWCAFVTAALADAVEGTDIFPAVTSVHATDPPPAIAELAHDATSRCCAARTRGCGRSPPSRAGARVRVGSRSRSRHASGRRVTHCPRGLSPSTTRARCSSAMACASRRGRAARPPTRRQRPSSASAGRSS